MIQISYQQTKEDVVEVTARSFSLKRKVAFALWMTIGVLSMFISAWLWDHDALLVFSWVPFFAGLGLCLGAVGSLPAQSAKHITKYLKDSACQAEISEAGVKGFREGIRMEFEWTAFQECWETKNLFALLFGVSYLMLPKRAFTSEQLTEFRELLARKLPQKK